MTKAARYRPSPSAGEVNAEASLADQRFVTHVATETVMRFGLDVGQRPLMTRCSVVLALFILGAFFSTFALQRWTRCRR